MVTRRTGTVADVLDVNDVSINEWAITESDVNSVTWTNPTTNEIIKLKPGMKPSDNIVSVARMNGAVLMARSEPHSVFDNEDENELLDEEPTSVDRVLTMLRSDVAAERAEVKIYRIKDGSKDVYCGSFQPDEFAEKNLELIRGHYGAGKYRIKVYATQPGSNKFVIRMNETVEIEQSNLIPISAPVSQNNQIMEALLTRLERMESGQNNGMGSMKEMLQMFVMMKTAFGGNEQQSQKSSIGEIVSAIRELREVSGEFGSGGSEKPDLLSMGSEVIKMIASNQPAQFPQPQFPPITVPQYQTNPTPEVEEIVQPKINTNSAINEIENENEMNPFVKIMFSVILKKAAENAPVEPIAKDLYVRLPDEILNMIESEMWLDLLSEFNPKVKEHEIWFSSLRTALLTEIANDEAEG